MVLRPRTKAKRNNRHRCPKCSKMMRTREKRCSACNRLQPKR